MPRWTDRDGRPVGAPEPPSSAAGHAAISDFQGPAYERNAFAQGTEQEVAFLVAALELRPGQRVLDAGCGTGRHARALGERGIHAVGVDVSARVLGVAQDRDPGRWLRADVRALPLRSGALDAALCLCQGGFGIGSGDERVVRELARVLRPGGRLALTAYSLAFAARFLDPDDAVDVGRSLVCSPAEVRGPDGAAGRFPLHSACYTPGHLALLCHAAGLELEAISGVEPGQYRDKPPDLRDPELLVRAIRH